jgi:hypothetical protein
MQIEKASHDRLYVLSLDRQFHALSVPLHRGQRKVSA